MKETDSDMKSVCFICSSGGHLNQALKIINDLPANEFDITLITYENEFTQQLGVSNEFKVILFPQETSELAGNPPVLLKHMLTIFYETLKILQKNRFDIIVSTGAEIAVPLMVFSRFAKSQFIYVESLSRTDKLSRSGQLSRYFADNTLAQWEDVAEKYESVEFRGRII